MRVPGRRRSAPAGVALRWLCPFRQGRPGLFLWPHRGRLSGRTVAAAAVVLLCGAVPALAPPAWAQVGVAPGGVVQGGAAQVGTAGTPPGVVGDTGTAPAPTPDPVVAEVEGRQIHLSELGDEIQQLPGASTHSFQAMYPAALRRLIEQTAIVLRAHQDGLSDDATVKRHMQEAADRVLEEAFLDRATAARVTEQMLLARYDSEIRGKPGPEEVHARAILVPTRAAAQTLVDKLGSGADFAALARQSSTDATAGAGGDLGFVRRDRVNPILGAVLFTLRPGEVTPYPVETPSGWFVLQAVARRQAPTPSFAEARAQLMAECQRDELAAVVRSALTGMTVHAYDMNGNQAATAGDDDAGRDVP